jgi:thioester reductase-like protein
MQAAQVKEWVDHSVKRILSLKPKRVLEIGCGTGLLLFRIAPEVAHYHGTDISSEAVQCIQRNLGDLTNRVSLSCIAAHELTPEQLSDYDLVIINSVIQYFPNFSYLKDLLSKLGQALPPNARIFLGDIRNFDLLETFHTSVQLVRSKDEGTIQDLNRRIQSRIAQEQGLLLSPKLFYRLSEEVPTLSLSRIELKRGQFVNELSKFRFDATLTVTRTESRKARNAELSRLIWGQDLEDLLGLDAILQSERRLPYLLERIPNNRIVCDMQTIEWLKVAPRAQSINSLRVELSKNATSGIEPESMHSIGESRKYNVYMSDSPNHLGFIDALFVPMEMGQKIEVPYPYPLLPTNEPLSVFAHTPKAPQSERALTREIMSHLNSRLPSYMVPANLVVLPDMPLTSSGKIDVRALPAPIQDRSEVMAEYKAPSTATEIWICEELQRLILIDTVGLHDNFFELGADSLNIVELVNRAQSRFSVSISLGAIFDSPTVAAIARELERAQQGSPIDSRGPSNVELFNDKELPDAYWVKPNMPLGNIDAPQSFFLTGATGFLGAFILERLLRATTSRIVCIVRAQSNQEASHRVKANLQRFGLWHDHFAARVECIAGDLGQPLFGLSADDYHQIASNIDVIIHNAAQVNLLYPYSALRHSNVMATRGILDFAVANRTKRLHFVSSLAVLETPEFSSSIEEPSEWRALHPETLSGGYAQTKWVCEELVWEAYRRGLPCSISRPGSVNSFRSLRGVLAHDLQMALLEEFVHYGKVPSFDWAMDLTPAEYVAEAILQASLNREFDGKCLHLVTKQSISKSDLVAELKRRDIPCQEIPYSDWISGVKERKQGPLRPFLSILTPGGANSEPYLRRSSTNLKCFSRVSEDILIRYHVEPPPSARELAVKVLDEIAAAQVTTSYSSGTGI